MDPNNCPPFFSFYPSYFTPIVSPKYQSQSQMSAGISQSQNYVSATVGSGSNVGEPHPVGGGAASDLASIPSLNFQDPQGLFEPGEFPALQFPPSFN
ncbi:hypothetical protein EGR_09126 [Echinococcus granulosus]|uniref:Uncharacterized protein n=1 Tax=Echinococcus granulosus TaxID=6210 RepID=W6U6N1_ECHGR|nr:hypothetical protein EGR_09126 [Echinococcus granulosus]EUB56001.1 hypothetical protein EGR_09126 [Echinococcus granulosus]